MKRIINYLVLIVLVLAINGCSKNPAKNKISDLSSEELFKKGWELYKSNEYNKSLEYFNILSTRQTYYLEGHLGLGWNYLKLNQAQNAKLQFNKFFDLDSLDIIVPTDSSFIEGKAGLSFACQLSHDQANAIANSSSIAINWSARFDENLNYSDIVLLRAISFYELTQYTQSLEMVKILDPTFNTDLNFLEGRITLAQKIEELKLLVD